MTNYTRDEIKLIKVLLNQLHAFVNTINEILNNKESAEHSRYVSYKDMALTYNDFEMQIRNVLKSPATMYTFHTDDMKGYMNTLWGEQKRILEQVLVSSKFLIAILESNVNFVNDEVDNLENFIFSKLRSIIFKKPEKETEVQNAIESLFVGQNMKRGIDYDRETGKFKFSGKEYIPDFIIPKYNLVIEVKLMREGKKSQIVEEISADITAYAKHYERQLFLVYDLGAIQNEDEFRRDIESKNNVKMVIVKH